MTGRTKKPTTEEIEAMYGRVSNQQAVQHQQALPRVSFFGTYLGAHENHPASTSGAFLTATAGGELVHREAQREFRKQPAMPARHLVYAPWSEVRDLEVDGTSKRRNSAAPPIWAPAPPTCITARAAPNRGFCAGLPQAETGVPDRAP